MVSGFLMLDSKHCVVQWNQRYEDICHWLKPVLRTGVPFRQLLEKTALMHLPGGSAEVITTRETETVGQAGPSMTRLAIDGCQLFPAELIT